MLLIRQIEPYSVIKLDPNGPLPPIPNDSDLWSITRTHDELSLVCSSAFATELGVIAQEDGWCAFRVAGTMEFSLTGVVARISDSIVRAGIGIFITSTFDTDYILIKEHDVRSAISAWKADHIDVTEPIIQTSRLILVDLAAEIDDVASSNREDKTWAIDYPTGGDVLIARLEQQAGNRPIHGAPSLFQVRLRSSGEAIGGIGFKATHDSPDLVGTEIGYSIAESHQGRGFATEAISGLIPLAHQRGMKKLLAETEPHNAPSIRALQKNGFTELRRTESGIWWGFSL